MDLNLQKWIDEMMDKLDVSDDQFAEELEQEKLSLSDWITAIRDEIEDEASEMMTELKTKLDELTVQLALGKAEAQSAAETQQDRLSQTLADTRASVSQLRDSAEHTGSAVLERLEEALSTVGASLQTKFDLARLKTSLGRAEFRDEWEANKAELRQKLDEMVEELNQTREKAETRGEELTREMGELYDKARSVVQHFFKPENKNNA